MAYFVISCNEDGEIRVHSFSEKELLKELNAEPGDGFCSLDEIKTTFNDKDDYDPNYWGNRACLIIKGEIVVPKAEQVVTKVKI